MAEYFDYKIITSSLIKAVRTLTNFPCIEANGTGDQPAYPFATFNITSPKITYERDNDNAQFELVVSLTWHDESSLSVLNLAKKCESYFKSSPGRDLFAEKNVVIVDVTDFNRRDNFISIEYERTAGFDISMRVMDPHADDISGMEGIQIN
ncbi:phage neck terminator protein [Peribacillus sp. NPDC046944]|uniref:phage neck terminator protein n=1 Tax=unclassified Peribacillus TaxID=2675266 RepID=UPI003D009D4C